MALVNYIEPIDPGNIFVGIGALLLSIVAAYIMYRFYIKIAQYLDVMINREAKYEILEEAHLDKIAAKKGIDLNKELIKRKMFADTKRKSFRRKVEEQIYEDMFGKQKEE
jgi:hypothetical protein